MSDKIIEDYISLRHGAVRPLAGSKESWVLSNYGKFFPENKNAAIIEVGPGLGENIDLLVNRLGYKNISFVDNSREVVELIKTSLGVIGELASDLEAYFSSVSPGTFDVVIMFHVIEHLPKDEVSGILRSILRSLKDGGIFLMETPNMENPLTATMHRYHDVTHQVGFTSLSLNQILRGAGFSEIVSFPVRPKMTGLFRLVQISGQLFVEYIIKLMFKLYNPNYKSAAMSQFVGVCAKK